MLTDPVTLPIWLFALILLFAAVTFASHFLMPSVRWYFRRRMQRVVAKLNARLERPIDPFKLAQRHDMINQLLYHPDVMAAVNEHADAEGIPEQVAFQQARRYAREIVPSFSATAYFGFATRAARVLSRVFYDVRVGHYSTALPNINSDATVVFVMNHRSNMDYVIVTHLAARQSALSYAVGEWARVWPLSSLIRSLGGFFIRRKSKGLLYRRVLARYVQMATEGGATQAVFPEGGLSLTGATAPPKMGILNYVVSAWGGKKGRDVVFVPVAINYDRVLEDYILIAASKRGERRFGANISIGLKFFAQQIWLRLTWRNNRLGAAAVNFGQPLYLSEFGGRKSPKAKLETVEVANELMHRINQAMPILPVPLVAHVLTQHGPMDDAQLQQYFAAALERLDEGYTHIPQNDAKAACAGGVANLLRRKLIEKTANGYSITAKGADVVPFYGASLGHLMAEKLTKT